MIVPEGFSKTNRESVLDSNVQGSVCNGAVQISAAESSSIENDPHYSSCKIPEAKLCTSFASATEGKQEVGINNDQSIGADEDKVLALAMSTAAEEIASETTSALSVNEILSCVVCCGLLSKAYTFECGHSLCGPCNEKAPRCPLPGATCSELSGFVVLLTDSGARTRLPRQQPAAQNVLLSKLTSEVVFSGEAAAADLRARANGPDRFNPFRFPTRPAAGFYCGLKPQ